MNMLACLKRRSPITALASWVPLLGLAMAVLPTRAEAGANPATQALDELQGKKAQLSVIQNKFFLKQNRFEIAPVLGYVPNNDLVTVPVGGLFLAYHFSESFAAEGSVLYGVDTGAGGLKGLARTLVQIGQGTDGFKQPVQRVQLGAIFDAKFAPVYGKINLIGEGVVNFDFYGTAGLGMLLISHEDATCDGDCTTPEGIFLLNPRSSAPMTANVAVNLGVGFDFFITQSIALKLDARGLLYIAKEPDYGNLDAGGNPVQLDNNLYNTFITTAGISIFVPKMKPRLSNF